MLRKDIIFKSPILVNQSKKSVLKEQRHSALWRVWKFKTAGSVVGTGCEFLLFSIFAISDDSF